MTPKALLEQNKKGENNWLWSCCDRNTKSEERKKRNITRNIKIASRMRLILRRLHVRSEVGVSWSIWRNAGTKLNIAKAIQLYTAPVQAKETTKNSWVEASFAYMKKLICWRVFSSQNRSRTERTRCRSKLRLLRKANSMLYAMRHVDYEFNIIKKKKKRPILRVHSSGTIPERDYTEEKQDAFFWVTFQFLNERNTILVIPPRRWMNRISSENGLSVYSHSNKISRNAKY